MSDVALRWSPASTPEAARVDAERLVQAVLGAEIGDRTVDLLAVLAGEPVPGAVVHVAVEGVQQRLVLGHQVDVVEDLGPALVALDQRNRVAVTEPGRGVDATEQDAYARVPHPVAVVGEALQAFELCRKSEPRHRQGGYVDPACHGGHPI